MKGQANEPNYDSGSARSLDIEALVDRVVIMVYESGIPTDQAKKLAAQAQGLRSYTHYWAWLRVYVKKNRLG